MIEKKTIKEFQSTGLLLFVNQFLHIFGWVIIVVQDEENSGLSFMYPARTKYRGFKEKYTDEAYKKVSEYMKENSETLVNDTK